MARAARVVVDGPGGWGVDEVVGGRSSYAFDGVGGQWRWYEENQRKLAIDEVRRCAEALSRDEGPLGAVDFRQLIHVKLTRAQQGRLMVPDDGRAQLLSEPGVMEIKWGLGSVQWRLYFCEPARLYSERVMLGLHFARKDSLTQQDEQIREAARRWRVWQSAIPY